MSIFNAAKATSGLRFFIAPGRKIYVNNANGTAGNDTTGDGSEGAPYATLSKAWADVRSGANDIIILRGSVTESTVLTLANKKDWLIKGLSGFYNTATGSAANLNISTAGSGYVRNSSTQIQVTFTAAHGLAVNDLVTFHNVTQSGDAKINGTWNVPAGGIVSATVAKFEQFSPFAGTSGSNLPFGATTGLGFATKPSLVISQCDNAIIDGVIFQSSIFADQNCGVVLSGGSGNFAGSNITISNCVFVNIASLFFHNVPSVNNLFAGGFGFRVEQNLWNRSETTFFQPTNQYVHCLHVVTGGDTIISENRFVYLNAVSSGNNMATPPIRITGTPLLGTLFTQNIFGNTLLVNTFVLNDFGASASKYSFLRNVFANASLVGVGSVAMDSGGFVVDSDAQIVFGQDYLYGDSISNRKIASTIWDEAQSGHTTAGTFGKYLDTEISGRLSTSDFNTKLGTPAGASVSVDIASVKSDTNSLNSTKITTTRANNLDNLDATVSSRESESSASTRASTDQTEHDATQSAIASLPTAGSIADAVWDEDQAAHQTTNTYGRLLGIAAGLIGELTITGTPSSTQIQTTLGSAVDNFYDDALVLITSGSGAGQARVISSYNGTTKTFTFDEALEVVPSVSDKIAVIATHIHAVSEIVSGVWNATLSSYLSPGSTGEALDNADAVSSPSAIADAVLDELISGHTISGSVGASLANLDATVSSRESESSASSRAATDQSEHDATQASISALSIPTSSQIADQVWDEAIAGHLGAGSTGEKLNSGTPINVQDIVDGVLDEALSAHTASGSTGEAIGRLDVAISTRESESSASSRASADIAEHDQTQADIAALGDFTVIKENFVEGFVDPGNIIGTIEESGALIGVVEDA